MRPCIPDGEINHRAHPPEIKLSAVALIRGGGIIKPVAQHDLAGGQSRTDHLADELRAAGVHQQQLRLGSHRVIRLAVLERVPDFLANGRAPRLAQGAHDAPEFAQAFGQQHNLRGLAAAFVAFKRDEQAAHETDGREHSTPNIQHSISNCRRTRRRRNPWTFRVER
jgi:hypothetical protein